MKKLFLVLLLIIPFIGNSQNIETPCQFRNVAFGNTVAECKTKETAEFIKEYDKSGLKVLYYSTSVFGLNASLLYIFAANKLTRTKYLFNEDYVNKNSYIMDFNSITEKLTEKYGQPKEENVYWINNLYRDEPSDYGLAISIGHVAYFTTYITDCMEIIVSMQGEKYEVNLEVEYSSIKYLGLEEEIIKAAQQKDY